MTETRYVYLKLPIVVEDNKFCKSCPHLCVPSEDDLETFTHCKLDPARSLNYFGNEILRSDECFWAEDEDDNFAYEIDLQHSRIYVKD